MFNISEQPHVPSLAVLCADRRRFTALCAAMVGVTLVLKRLFIEMGFPIAVHLRDDSRHHMHVSSNRRTMPVTILVSYTKPFRSAVSE